ncbi:hypothetical protein C8Q75DRAFT_732094 [Abortiporus biennis]|nr:hypothetical protein C8Q75DRAFT_732082 [Abortiporus biennis]KAI0791678.1 hypothetical protein C8Q75DRAFT_732086 [Abortiporus biennis]KAI0791685.1 hypothetical protein C8Q75DRAFT_732094 [Abortiporus biennis]
MVLHIKERETEIEHNSSPVNLEARNSHWILLDWKPIFIHFARFLDLVHEISQQFLFQSSTCLLAVETIIEVKTTPASSLPSSKQVYSLDSCADETAWIKKGKLGIFIMFLTLLNREDFFVHGLLPEEVVFTSSQDEFSNVILIHSQSRNGTDGLPRENTKPIYSNVTRTLFMDPDNVFGQSKITSTHSHRTDQFKTNTDNSKHRSPPTRSKSNSYMLFCLKWDCWRDKVVTHGIVMQMSPVVETTIFLSTTNAPHSIGSFSRKKSGRWVHNKVDIYLLPGTDGFYIHLPSLSARSFTNPFGTYCKTLDSRKPLSSSSNHTNSGDNYSTASLRFLLLFSDDSGNVFIGASQQVHYQMNISINIFEQDCTSTVSVLHLSRLQMKSVQQIVRQPLWYIFQDIGMNKIGTDQQSSTSNHLLNLSTLFSNATDLPLVQGGR